MIKEKYIDAIKSRVDISQLVMDLCPGTSLRSAGKNRKKCCCVFHNEKTPSLMLDLSLNMYKCFGCGKGGDIISFVRELKGFDFVEAVKFLLKTYCPDVDTSDLYSKLTDEEKEAEQHRESLFICNQYAYDFFRQQYEADCEESARCRLYAEDRWEREFCKTLGLGYAPSKGNQFLAFAKKQGLKTELLLELGLIFLLISQDISNLILPDEKGRVVIVALGVLDEEQGRAHRISFWVESLRIPHVQRIEKGLQVLVGMPFLSVVDIEDVLDTIGFHLGELARLVINHADALSLLVRDPVQSIDESSHADCPCAFTGVIGQIAVCFLFTTEDGERL